MTTADLVLGFVPLARPTFDTELAAQVTAQARGELGRAGLKLAGPVSLIMDLDAAHAAGAGLAGQSIDLLLVFQASFADSSMTRALAQAVDAPLLLWAVPEAATGGRLRLNSMCGINLAGHALTRAGLRYDYVYAEPGDAVALGKAKTLAQAGRVRRLLRQARIGRIGENPAGFESCLVDAAGLRQRLGLEVVQVELETVFAGVRAGNGRQTEAVKQQLSRQVAGLDEVDQVALAGTLGVYQTLAGLARQENLHGLAVRCWPEFFTELGEADVNGTITQLILQSLSGEPAFGADLVSLDAAWDGIVIWHCGLAPLAMADPAFQPRATIHSNRKLPLLMEFPLNSDDS